MIKLSFIRKLPNGKYRVYSEKGKNLGTYDSLKGAKNRLRQVEYFKHASTISTLIKQAKEDEIDFTYSSIMRHLNKNNKELIPNFMELFLEAFNDACQDEEDIDKIEKMCLMQTLKSLNLNG